LLSYEDVEVFDLLVNQKEPLDASIKPLVDVIIASHIKTIEKDR
jgi:hypothetical protein